MNTLQEIDERLRDSAQKPLLPANFKGEVWTRIAHAEQRPLMAGPGKVLAVFARPIPAFSSVIVMMVIGGWLGCVTAPSPGDARLHYAESISPFLQEFAP